MTLTRAGARITLKNVLYLTDFSKFSETALPFAVAMARNYGASVHALHVLTPPIPEPCHEAFKADERLADAEMDRVGARLADVEHDGIVMHGAALWPVIDTVINDQKIDLIVLGTHGRTGVQKAFLGSFAEEIFRRSSVPVLTIGPNVPKCVHSTGNFQAILLATDFSKESAAAVPFAVSLAEETNGHLILLNVMPKSGMEHSATVILNLVKNLHELVPSDAKMQQEPSAVIKHGEAADRILQVAAECEANLIVLGVRAARHLDVATRLDRATANKVVAHAKCPVLTVRG